MTDQPQTSAKNTGIYGALRRFWLDNRPPRAVRRAWREHFPPALRFDEGPPRTRPPIFVIGFNKTATTSIHHWFRASGIRTAHHGGYTRKNNLAARMEANLEAKRPLLSGFDCVEAFSDLSHVTKRRHFEANGLFKEMHAEYPDAYFILNHREPAGWIRSRRAHNEGTFAKRSAAAHGVGLGDLDAVWLTTMEAHFAAARSYFATADARFLDVFMDDTAAGKIARFLEPDYCLDPKAMPRKNVRASAVDEQSAA